jgi:deoxyribodipyrimidine photo-lyase
MKPYNRALHVFRRDLRLHDNTALLFALKHAREVVPCFILDTRQVEEHSYRSLNALQFMAGSLRDLDKQLRSKGGRLFVFRGVAEQVVEELVSSSHIDLVTMNRDYTPFSRKRDQSMQALLRKRGIECSIHSDALLNEPEAVHKQDLKPYMIFTPFRKKAQLIPVAMPVENTYTNYASVELANAVKPSMIEQLLPQRNPHLLLNGGRTEGLRLIGQIETLSDYDEKRDYPAKDYTSHLSAHNKFGTVSIREVYNRTKSLFGPSHTLLSELYWREFFTHIVYHFPHVIGGAFHERYNALKWSNREDYFEAWCSGNTGFPIVDAGMRELNTTGYMHNRVRMVVASFLVKDLHIDWRWGERYFAQNLIDYDPAVNNGNWQWAASTGCDAQPYFRIFNPWRQQQRFDPECVYIRKWVPELDGLSPKDIHGLEKQRGFAQTAYPDPLVNHRIASAAAESMFASMKR